MGMQVWSMPPPPIQLVRSMALDAMAVENTSKMTVCEVLSLTAVVAACWIISFLLLHTFHFMNEIRNHFQQKLSHCQH